MDTSFLPLLLLILAWVFLGSRGKNKNPKNAVKTEKSASAKTEKHSPAGNMSRPAPVGNIEARLAKEFPHLFASTERSASGSLPDTSTEGKDPCHDDYAGMRTGSLRVETPEGTDPCHEDWEAPADADAEAPAAAGGLSLSFGGNDIVKGFVYGEILKRKIG